MCFIFENHLIRLLLCKFNWFIVFQAYAFWLWTFLAQRETDIYSNVILLDQIVALNIWYRFLESNTLSNCPWCHHKHLIEWKKRAISTFTCMFFNNPIDNCIKKFFARFKYYLHYATFKRGVTQSRHSILNEYT